MAINSKGRRSNESICEKSMLLVANIIKLSTSLSFSNITHTAGATAGRRSSAVAAQLPAADPVSRRLQEPVSRAKPIYVAEPKYSSYVIHEEREKENNVDGWASKYIEKVHKKNRKSLEETIKKKPYPHL